MNILTFDIEDWFHILDNDSTKSEAEWTNYESRLDLSIDLILEMLERHKQDATFFILGWVAEKHPHIVKRIAENGFEIASHSYLHQLVYEQNKGQFKSDLARSVKVLEDITGQKVISYRAPGFSITEQTKWAFDCLLDEGIQIDSSIFPATRGHGGYPSFGSSSPAIIETNGEQIKEFPINTKKVLGKDLIFSGGGYFRLTPYRMIDKWTKQSEYVMTYFHPRDFDPGQPMLKDLPITRKFKSYVGLKNCQSKFEKWLENNEFVDLRTAVNTVDWDQAKIIQL